MNRLLVLFFIALWGCSTLIPINPAVPTEWARLDCKESESIPSESFRRHTCFEPGGAAVFKFTEEKDGRPFLLIWSIIPAFSDTSEVRVALEGQNGEWLEGELENFRRKSKLQMKEGDIVIDGTLFVLVNEAEKKAVWRFIPVGTSM